MVKDQQVISLEESNLNRIGELIGLIPFVRKRIKILEGELKTLEKKIKSLSDSISSTGYDGTEGYLESALKGRLRNGSKDWCHSSYPKTLREISEYGQMIFELNQAVVTLRGAEAELQAFNLKMAC